MIIEIKIHQKYEIQCPHIIFSSMAAILMQFSFIIIYISLSLYDAHFVTNPIHVLLNEYVHKIIFLIFWHFDTIGFLRF